MIQSKTLFAAALLGTALAVAGLVAAPFNASARAAASPTHAHIVAERIGGAFASVEMGDTAPAVRAAMVRLPKGDLGAAPSCEQQTWPNIAADCLAAEDGSTVQTVRFVTIGMQEGVAETVLLRIPAAEAAAR